MFHFAGSIIALFLAFLLLTKRSKQAADFVLAAWLVVISLHTGCYYLLVTGEFVTFPYLLGVEIPLPLAHGPFLYLYVSALVRPARPAWPWLLHFIPAVAAYFGLSGFFLLPFADKIQVYQSGGKGYEQLLLFIRYPIIPSGIVYVALSLLALRRHRAQLPHQFSFEEKINLDWLAYLTLGIGAIWLSVIFGNDFSTFLLVDVFIVVMGYFGIRQTAIFSYPKTSSALPETPAAATEDEKAKYLKTAIQAEDLSRIHTQLAVLMREKKVFQDPGLSLDGLAGMLGVSANALSQVINTVEQRNFYDYVNEFRVKEFQRIANLPENSHLTLLSLAFEAGFNSKTSFNRNFKKATGLSPSEYCSQQQTQPGNTA